MDLWVDHYRAVNFEARGFLSYAKSTRNFSSFRWNQSSVETMGAIVPRSGGSTLSLIPNGATGVAQICDVALQIRGEAGERQLKRNQIGLAQNLGGSGATCVVSILGAA